MEIEQKIRMLLAYKNISQAELARKLGTSPTNLNNKIRNNRLLCAELERIADILEVKLKIQFEIGDDII